MTNGPNDDVRVMSRML